MLFSRSLNFSRGWRKLDRTIPLFRASRIFIRLVLLHYCNTLKIFIFFPPLITFFLIYLQSLQWIWENLSTWIGSWSPTSQSFTAGLWMITHLDLMIWANSFPVRLGQLRPPDRKIRARYKIFHSKRISPLFTVWNWLSCLTLLARDRLVSAGSDFLHVAQRARFLLNQ